jgi:hypothetical protein
MVSSLERYKPVKLEGRPLVITKEGKLQVSRPRHIYSAIAGAKKYLKPELLQPLLGQLDASVNVPEAPKYVVHPKGITTGSDGEEMKTTL